SSDLRFVVVTGERCRDLAVRLRHAGVAHATVPDQLEALAVAGTARIEYVGNYTAFQGLRRALARRRSLAPPVGAGGPDGVGSGKRLTPAVPVTVAGEAIS